jgi:hypothetical protein
MKRTPVLLVFACAIIALSMVSCDAMFSNNVFGGLTHKKITADSLQGQSPSELKDTLDSDYNRGQVAEDPQLKQAVLDQLEPSYDTPAEAATSEGQVAAILAADIIIGTDPAASQLVAGAIGAIETITNVDQNGDGVITTQEATDTLTQVMNDILPLDIQGALNSGSPEPPQAFIDMIAAFTAADVVYGDLNAGLAQGGGYAPEVTNDEQVEVAVNALVSGFVGIIVPASLGDTVAEALWSAMLDPENALSYIDVSGAAYDNLTGDNGIGFILDSLESMN